MSNPYDHLQHPDDDTFGHYRTPNLNATAALYQQYAQNSNGISHFNTSLNPDAFTLAAVNNAQRRCVQASLFGSIEPPKNEEPPDVTICNSEMWKRFNKVGTEMIITKTGRRLFPTIKINVRGLDDSAKYVFAMDIVPVDDSRYKYHDNRWIVTGKAEPHLRASPYIHPDSPCTGAQWMRQSVSFHKMKLTNNPITPHGQVLLNSMHKYKPRLHIFRYSEVIGYQWHSVHSYTFLDTEFIAVTAYQNDQVTQLKIDHNPFAKGFREGNHSRRDRNTLKRDHHGNRIYQSNNNGLNETADDLDGILPAKRSCQNPHLQVTSPHKHSRIPSINQTHKNGRSPADPSDVDQLNEKQLIPEPSRKRPYMDDSNEHDDRKNYARHAQQFVPINIHGLTSSMVNSAMPQNVHQQHMQNQYMHIVPPALNAAPLNMGQQPIAYQHNPLLNPSFSNTFGGGNTTAFLHPSHFQNWLNGFGYPPITQINPMATSSIPPSISVNNYSFLTTENNSLLTNGLIGMNLPPDR